MFMAGRALCHLWAPPSLLEVEMAKLHWPLF
jgi:hypothetical protein